LHPLVEFERGVVDQKVEKDMSLDIFEMTTNTNQLTMELVDTQLLIYKHIMCMLKHQMSTTIVGKT
jgi:hypothetical protein